MVDVDPIFPVKLGSFKGEKLSQAELLRIALADDYVVVPSDDWVLRHTVVGAAASARRLLDDGEPLDGVWRFAVLQAYDDYRSAVKYGGLKSGAEFFAGEPGFTGLVKVDAAFAALADWLAQRDGWVKAVWVDDPRRVTDDPWFPECSRGFFREEALQYSPPPFRSRGIFITSTSMNRA
ncbi:MAG: hypothetical protein ACRDAX_08660 [Propionibacteriaceae bacterium]